MERITEKILKAKVELLNNTKGFINPKYGTIDSYTIGYAYGGVCLHQYCKSGGVINTFNCGYITKRDLFNRICAYIEGIREGNN